jgi:hypothetical protein
MPTIIDTSIFTGDLFISNSVATPDIHGGTQPNNINKLTLAIQKYEKLLLVNALGIVQYNALIAASGDTSGKWYDLINGKEYGDKAFPGIKPIIAYNVYVNFLKHDPVQFNTTGLERSDAKNSTSVDSRGQMADYWNTFVDMYQGMPHCGCFLYWFTDYDRKRTYVTLEQYLRDFPDDYNFGFFQYYRTQNHLGI